MTLDQIRKLIEELPSGPWEGIATYYRDDHVGVTLRMPNGDGMPPRGLHEYLEAFRVLLPALHKAVVAAEDAWLQSADDRDWRAFSNALDDIEALPIPP